MDLDPQGQVIGGYQLRYFLSLVVNASTGPVGIEELRAALGAAGLRVHGRAGKAISDALRTEVRRRRVVRVGRGAYAAGRLARSTEWWYRQKLEEHRSSGAWCGSVLPVLQPMSELTGLDPVRWIEERTAGLER